MNEDELELSPEEQQIFEEMGKAGELEALSGRVYIENAQGNPTPFVQSEEPAEQGLGTPDAPRVPFSPQAAEFAELAEDALLEQQMAAASQSKGIALADLGLPDVTQKELDDALFMLHDESSFLEELFTIDTGSGKGWDAKNIPYLGYAFMAHEIYGGMAASAAVAAGSANKEQQLVYLRGLAKAGQDKTVLARAGEIGRSFVTTGAEFVAGSPMGGAAARAGRAGLRVVASKTALKRMYQTRLALATKSLAGRVLLRSPEGVAKAGALAKTIGGTTVAQQAIPALVMNDAGEFELFGGASGAWTVAAIQRSFREQDLTEEEAMHLASLMNEQIPAFLQSRSSLYKGFLETLTINTVEMAGVKPIAKLPPFSYHAALQVGVMKRIMGKRGFAAIQEMSARAVRATPRQTRDALTRILDGPTEQYLEETLGQIAAEAVVGLASGDREMMRKVLDAFPQEFEDEAAKYVSSYMPLGMQAVGGGLGAGMRRLRQVQRAKAQKDLSTPIADVGEIKLGDTVVVESGPHVGVGGRVIEINRNLDPFGQPVRDVERPLELAPIERPVEEAAPGQPGIPLPGVGVQTIGEGISPMDPDYEEAVEDSVVIELPPLKPGGEPQRIRVPLQGSTFARPASEGGAPISARKSTAGTADDEPVVTPLTAEEYGEFVETGEVSEGRAEQIALKISRGQELTPQEQELREGASERIEEKLQQLARTKGTPETREADREAFLRALNNEIEGGFDGDIEVVGADTPLARAAERATGRAGVPVTFVRSTDGSRLPAAGFTNPDTGAVVIDVNGRLGVGVAYHELLHSGRIIVGDGWYSSLYNDLVELDAEGMRRAGEELDSARRKARMRPASEDLREEESAAKVIERIGDYLAWVDSPQRARYLADLAEQDPGRFQRLMERLQDLLSRLSFGLVNASERTQLNRAVRDLAGGDMTAPEKAARVLEAFDVLREGMTRPDTATAREGTQTQAATAQAQPAAAAQAEAGAAEAQEEDGGLRPGDRVRVFGELGTVTEVSGTGTDQKLKVETDPTGPGIGRGGGRSQVISGVPASMAELVERGAEPEAGERPEERFAMSLPSLRVSAENMPGANARVLKWLHLASPEIRQEFHARVSAAFINPTTGRDELGEILAEFGYELEPTTEVMSASGYINSRGQLEINPADAVTGFETEEAAIAYALLRGLYTYQEAVAGYSPTEDGGMLGLRIETGAPLNDASVADVLEGMRSVLADRGIEDAHTDFALYPHDEGFSLIHLGFDSRVTKDVLTAVADTVVERSGGRLRGPFNTETLYFENDWEKQPKGEGYSAQLGNLPLLAGRGSDLLGRVDRRVGVRLQEIYDEFAERGLGGATPEQAREEEQEAQLIEQALFDFAKKRGAGESWLTSFWSPAVKGTKKQAKFSSRNLRRQAKRAVEDVYDFIRSDPVFLDYYERDRQRIEALLHARYPDVAREEITALFQIFSGLLSPQTKLPQNIVEALKTTDEFRREGNLQRLALRVTDKGNIGVGANPLGYQGTVAPTKIRVMKILDDLFQERGVLGGVKHLQEMVTWKELQEFNRSLGYKTNVKKGEALAVIREATGQDKLFPRMFVFGPKLGAYTLNSLGDSRFTTTDIWEGRFIRSYFRDLFKEGASGLPTNVDERDLFQRFAGMFREELESKLGVTFSPAALQAVRWFYIIRKMNEAGYKDAQTDQVVSVYLERAIEKVDAEEQKFALDEDYQKRAQIKDDIADRVEDLRQEAYNEARKATIRGPQDQLGIEAFKAIATYEFFELMDVSELLADAYFGKDVRDVEILDLLSPPGLSSGMWNSRQDEEVDEFGRVPIPTSFSPRHLFAWQATYRAMHRKVLAELAAIKAARAAQDGESAAGEGGADSRFALAPPIESQEFQDWFGESAVTQEDGAPRPVYRGVQSPDNLMRGRLKLLSFTTSPQIASVYAAKPSGFGGGEFQQGASVSQMYLSIKNPLRLGGNKAQMTMAEYAEALSYGQDNGITDEELRRAVNYLINRNEGRVRAGAFSFETEEMADEESFSLRDPLRSFRSELQDFGVMDIGSELMVDVFALADAPVTRKVAQRLGYDGLRHMDVFSAREFAADLADVDPSEVEGLSSEFSQYAARERSGFEDVHETFRPFDDAQVKSATGNDGSFSAQQADPRFALNPQLETERFRRFFSGSHAIDPEGRPLMLYHLGRVGMISEFDKRGRETKVEQKPFTILKPGGRDPRISGRAIWMGTDPDNLPAAHNQVTTRSNRGQSGTFIMPLYAAIKRPLYVDGKTFEWAREVYGASFPELVSDEAVEMLREDGYDGVMFYAQTLKDRRAPDMDEIPTEVLALSSNQVKSAIGNTGAFSEDPDTRFALDAFHGTPWTFDKFTTDSIGSGEGAAAYGWGLYFASRRSVAEWYRKNLTLDDEANTPILELPSGEQLGFKYYNQSERNTVASSIASDVFYGHVISLEQAIEQELSRIEEARGTRDEGDTEDLDERESIVRELAEIARKGEIRVDTAYGLSGKAARERVTPEAVDTAEVLLDKLGATPSNAAEILRGFAIEIQRADYQRSGIALETPLPETGFDLAALFDANVPEEERQVPASIGLGFRVLAEAIDRGRLDHNLRDQSLMAGNVLQVRLEPSEGQYLEWDLPMSEQSDTVKKAARALLGGDENHKRHKEIAAQLAALSQEALRAPRRLHSLKRRQQDLILFDVQSARDAVAEGANFFEALLARETDPVANDRYDRLEAEIAKLEQRIRTFPEVYAELEAELNFTGKQMLNLDGLTGAMTLDFPDTVSGQKFYRNALEPRFGDDRGASLALLKAGVRGIRFLDGQSRAQGKGTYNYVIFDAEDISIQARFALAPEPSESDGIATAAGNLGFYSPTLRAATKIELDTIPKADVIPLLRKYGAKKAELEWMDLEPVLEEMDAKSLSKAELVELVGSRQYSLEEVNLVTWAPHLDSNLSRETWQQRQGQFQEFLQRFSGMYELEQVGDAWKVRSLNDEYIQEVIGKHFIATFEFESEEAAHEALIERATTYFAKIEFRHSPLYAHDTLREEGSIQGYTEFLVFPGTASAPANPFISEKQHWTTIASSFSLFNHPIGWVRATDRAMGGAKQANTLFLEEMQSDWMSQLRKKEARSGDRVTELPSDVRVVKGTLIREPGDTQRYAYFFGTAEGKQYIDPVKHQRVLTRGAASLKGGETLYSITHPELEAAKARGSYSETKRLTQFFQSEEEATKAALDYVNRDFDRSPPPSPFVKSYYEVLAKRMVMQASLEGKDKIAWTPGWMQARRYDYETFDRLKWRTREKGELLAGYIDITMSDRSSKERKTLTVNLEGVVTVIDDTYLESERQKPLASLLPGSVMKHMRESAAGNVTSADLGGNFAFDGNGFHNVYDSVLVKAFEKLGKRYGAKVTMESLKSDPYFYQRIGDVVVPDDNVHVLELTPELKQAATERGFSLFAMAGNKRSQDAAGLDMPDGGTIRGPWDRIVRAMGDRYVSVKNYVDWAKSRGASMNDDPESALRRFFGKIADRAERIEDGFTRPLSQLMAASGITFAQAGEYVKMRHIPEANAHFAKQHQEREAVKEQKLILHRRVRELKKLRTEQVAARAEAKRERSRMAADGTLSEEGMRFFEGEVALAEAEVKETETLLREAERSLKDAERTINGLQHVAFRIPEGQTAEEFFAETRPMYGIKTSEARRYIERQNASEQGAALREIGTMLDQFNQKTRDKMYEDGLLTEAQYLRWNTQFKHYVPMRRADVENQRYPGGRGRGFGVSGPETKMRRGGSRVDNPLSFSLMQAQDAIARGEKNQVGLEFLNWARANAGLLGIEVREAERDDDGEIALKPSEFKMKENGKDMVVNVMDPDLANALKGVGGGISIAQLGPAAQAYTKAFMLWRSLVTSHNPAFMFGNFFRDAMQGLMNTTSLEAKFGVEGLKKATAKDLKGAMAATHRWRRNIRKDPNFVDDSREGRYLEEYRRAGGRIGMYTSLDFESIDEQFAKQAALLERDDLIGAGKRTLVSINELVNDANLAVETAVRLAAFMAMRDRGVSANDAALAARQLTTDFNQTGEWGPVLSSIWAFFSATVGGTRRNWQEWKNPSARKLIGGMIAFGYFSHLLNDFVSDDDEDGQSVYSKIPEHEKARNIIFAIPGTRTFVKIPSAYGWSIFFNVGRYGAEFTLGQKTEARVAKDMALETFTAFSPISSSASAYQAMAPTLVEPFVQIEQNQNFAGAPIRPMENPFAPETARHRRHMRSTNKRFVELAKGINYLTGGDDIDPGWINLGGDDIEHLFEFGIGGAGKFWHNLLYKTPVQMMRGEYNAKDLETAPIIRKFYGARTEFTDTSNFYDEMDDLERMRMKIRVAKEDGDYERAAELQRRYGKLLPFLKRGETVKKQVRALTDRAYKDTPYGDDDLLKQANSVIQAWMKDYFAAGGTIAD